MIILEDATLLLTSDQEVLKLLNEADREPNITMINRCAKVLRNRGYKLIFDKKASRYEIIK